MYSMLEEIDKYIKENNIKFKAIAFNKNYLPEYINMAIARELKKSSNTYYSETFPDYELRYDDSGSLYILVHNQKCRENFVICMNDRLVDVPYKISGKKENHIMKMGCIFKLLENKIKQLNNEIDYDFPFLSKKSKEEIRYNLINDLIEAKYKEIIDNHGEILAEFDCQEDIIESTYKLMDYIRYLNGLYNDSVLVRKKK